jgi:hypothetical protein
MRQRERRLRRLQCARGGRSHASHDGMSNSHNSVAFTRAGDEQERRHTRIDRSRKRERDE